MDGDLGSLVLHLGAEISEFKDKLSEAAEHMKGSFEASLVTGELVAEGIEKIADAFVDLGKEAVEHMEEVQKVNAQTAAVLKSTGEAAHVSTEGVHELAESLAKVSGVAPEVIQSGENMLLTFTNIKNGVGEGNDVFDQATKTVLDMSTALGEDGKSAAIQLGKALNDPIKGVTALQRVGVTFTEGQKAQIQAMVDAGNTMGAQKLILHELNTEFGGSAEAYGQTLPGAIGRFKTAWDEVTESLTNGAMPAIRVLVNEGADAFDKLAESIKGNGLIGAMDHLTSPDTKAAFIGIAGAITAAMVPSMMEAAEAAGATIIAWAPFIALAAAIAFAAKPIIDNWTGLTQDLQADWQDLKAGVNSFMQAVHDAFSQIGSVVSAAANYIKSALAPVFDMLPDGVKKAIGVVGQTIGNLPNMVLPTVKSVVSSVGSTMKGIGHAITDPWSGAVSGVTDLISKMMHAAPDAITKETPHLGEAAENAGGAMTKAMKKAAAEAKKHAEEIAKAFAEIPKQLKGIDMKGALTGMSELEITKAKVNALSSDLKSLIDKGVSPTDSRMKALAGTLQSLSARYDQLKEAADVAKQLQKQQDILDALSTGFEVTDAKAAAFGDSVNVASEKASLLKSAIESLIKNGMDPHSAKITELMGQYKSLEDASERTKKALDATKVLKDVSTQLAEVTAESKVMGTGYDAASAKVDVLKNAMKKLIEDGVAPTDERIQGLKQQLETIKPPPSMLLDFLDNAKGKIDGVTSPITNLQDSLGKLGEDLGIKVKLPFEDTISSAVKAGTEFGNVASDVGKLIPVMMSLGSSIVSMAITAMPMLAGFVTTTLIPSIIAFGATLGAAMLPITLIAAGIAGLIAVGQSLMQHWSQVSAFIQNVWRGIAKAGQMVFGGIASVVQTTMTAISTVITTIWDGVMAFVGPVLELLGGLISASFGIISSVISASMTVIYNVMTGVWNSIVSVLGPIWNALGSAAQSATSVVRGAFEDLGNFLVGTINVFIDLINLFIAGLNSIKVPSWVPGVGGWGVNIPQIKEASTSMFSFGQSASTAANQMVDAQEATAEMAKQVDSLNKTFSSGIDSTFSDSIKGFLNGTKDLTSSLQTGIRDAIINGVVQATMQKAVMQGALGNLMNQLSNEAVSGQDMSGTIAQIKGAIPGISQSIQSMYGSLKDALSGFGGAPSPSPAASSASAPDPLIAEYTQIAGSMPADNRMTFDQFKKMVGSQTSASGSGVSAMPSAVHQAVSRQAASGSHKTSNNTTVNLHYHGTGKTSKAQAEEMLGHVVKAARTRGIKA